MESTRHIFIQVDTDEIIRHSNPQAPPPLNVNEYTKIFDQGWMALGSAIKNFDINASTDELIYFTIVPNELSSYHKLYFTSFDVISTDSSLLTVTPIMPIKDQISFKIKVDEAKTGGFIQFALGAMIDYEQYGNLVSLPILIDPVLRANQGN
ncbi:MAG: hypothetical protein PSV16_09560 [Flavobacterium sp.]|nr:hypothetical protein [Flavobacterium sp.]